LPQRLLGPAFAWSAFLAVGMSLAGCQMSVVTVVQEKVKGKQVDPVLDLDGDGVTELGGDCDDGDAAIFPGATEACDGIDNDCSDSVDDAGACTTYRSMSQTALADVLEGLLKDRELRARLGQGGRQRVIDEFSMGINAARLINAFESAQH